MKCPDQETLFDYCEGSAAAEVEAHLAACASCRETVEAHRSMWSALDEWSKPAVSSDFDQKLYRRIEEERARINWWRQPLAAAAALVIVAGTAWMVEQSAPPPPEPSTVTAISDVEDTLEDLEMLRQLQVVKTAREL